MQGFLITLFLCSATMSVLALAFMALTPLLAKRYSAMSQYYAWLVIVVGLVIPYRPHFSNPMLQVAAPGNVSVPLLRLGNAASVLASAPAANGRATMHPDITWQQAAIAVWLLGMLTFFTYHAVRHYRFLKLTARWSEAVTDEQTLALFENVKAQLGVHKKIRLQVCGSIGSPMLTGVMAPCIILPDTDFSAGELAFILKHELVHYKRKDIWYKSLVLIAAAMHWFNPVIYLIVKAIDVQCELSCDAEVIRSADADTRYYYSEIIIGVARYQSKRKTAFSTHFYGGKKGMRSRIFSIMDRSKKKAGFSILSAVFIFTLGTGAFAANADAQKPSGPATAGAEITPSIASSFYPDPAVYAKYANLGIGISEDGTQLLYKRQPVRLFADDGADTEAFYLNAAGNVDLSVKRNAAGEIIGIETITEAKAQEYQDAFFAEERNNPVEAAQNTAKVVDIVKEGREKYDQYKPFGVTYSQKDNALYYNGQRVGFFLDRPADGSAGALWTDEAGTLNLEVIRDASGQITGVESISDEKAKDYQSAAEEQAQIDEAALEEKIADRMITIKDGYEKELEMKMKALYPNGIK